MCLVKRLIPPTFLSKSELSPKFTIGLVSLALNNNLSLIASVNKVSDETTTTVKTTTTEKTTTRRESRPYKGNGKTAEQLPLHKQGRNR